MSDSFADFGMGDGDSGLGKKNVRFDPEAGKTYVLSFVWYREYGTAGVPNLTKGLRYTSCERIYKEGLGYVLYKGPAYADFGKPKTAIATIIALWPSDGKGNADMTRLAEVQIMPWVFSPDKYEILSRANDKFALIKHDIAVTCTDSKFKKISITPDNKCVIDMLRHSDKPGAATLLNTIYQSVANVASNIRNDLARDLSLDEIREKLNLEVSGPTNRTSRDADSLLDDIV